MCLRWPWSVRGSPCRPPLPLMDLGEVLVCLERFGLELDRRSRSATAGSSFPAWTWRAPRLTRRRSEGRPGFELQGAVVVGEGGRDVAFLTERMGAKEVEPDEPGLALDAAGQAHPGFARAGRERSCSLAKASRAWAQNRSGFDLQAASRLADRRRRSPCGVECPAGQEVVKGGGGRGLLRQAALLRRTLRVPAASQALGPAQVKRPGSARDEAGRHDRGCADPRPDGADSDRIRSRS